jgi:hypothetical protein
MRAGVYGEERAFGPVRGGAANEEASDIVFTGATARALRMNQSAYFVTGRCSMIREAERRNKIDRVDAGSFASEPCISDIQQKKDQGSIMYPPDR